MVRKIFEVVCVAIIASFTVEAAKDDMWGEGPIDLDSENYNKLVVNSET